MNEGQAHERLCGRRPVRSVGREDAQTVQRTRGSAPRPSAGQSPAPGIVGEHPRARLPVPPADFVVPEREGMLVRHGVELPMSALLVRNAG